MLPNTDFHIFYLSFAILVSVTLIPYAYRNRQTRGSMTFIAGCVVSIFWILSDILSRMDGSYETQVKAETIRYLSAPLLPIILTIFIIQYSGKSMPPGRLIKLFIVPALTWVVLLTNSWHHLFATGMVADADGRLIFTFGIYFWLIHLPYSYGVFAVGLFMLLREYTRSSHNYRVQISMLFFAMCLPFAINIVGLLGLIGRFTPHSFPIFFTTIAFLIFRYQFLGSNPIAYEAVFQAIRDGVLILDGQDIIRDINPAAADGLNKKPSAVIGSHVRDAFAAWPSATKLYDENPRELGEIEAFLFGSKRYLLIESRTLSQVSGNYSDGRIITIRDITERHSRMLSLQELAFHDPLTRLANRRKFEEEVEVAIGNQKPFAIFYFDLNRFKEVNDTYGHDVGDELLKYVAARVASTLRKPDIMARLGGDEFALLVHDCNEISAELVIERLLENVTRPFKVGEVELTAALSIGTAFYPKDGASLSQLLRHADDKMYQVKQNRIPNFIGNKVEVAAMLEM